MERRPMEVSGQDGAVQAASEKTVPEGIAAEISRGTVGIYKEHLGRGPTKARTSIRDDTVAIVLQDSLTKAEIKLRGGDRSKAVRFIRREFQEAMRDELVALVETKLHREVVCF